MEAVAQTHSELVRSLLRVASENGHLVRRARAVGHEVVPYGGSDMYSRERAAALPRPLCATASMQRGSVPSAGLLASVAGAKPGVEDPGRVIEAVRVADGDERLTAGDGTLPRARAAHQAPAGGR